MLPVIALSVFLLVTTGVYLVLHRSLLRVALGLACLSHAVNLLVLSAGRWGARAPLVTGSVQARELSDPVTQAFVLTAIVISMAFTLYLLAGMAEKTRRGDAPELFAPPEADEERSGERLLEELEGRGVEP